MEGGEEKVNHSFLYSYRFLVHVDSILGTSLPKKTLQGDKQNRKRSLTEERSCMSLKKNLVMATLVLILLSCMFNIYCVLLAR